ERPSGRATPSLRDAPGDAPIQIDAVPKLIVAPHTTDFVQSRVKLPTT
ncbi:plasmid pRiA4b ORF-3 family protein, partial [Sinorhizobium meliloti]